MNNGKRNYLWGFGPCEKLVDHRVWRVTHINRGENRPNREGTGKREVFRHEQASVRKENLLASLARRHGEGVAVSMGLVYR